jgi:hypothetical protein
LPELPNGLVDLDCSYNELPFCPDCRIRHRKNCIGLIAPTTNSPPCSHRQLWTTHIPIGKEQLKMLRALGVVEGKAPYVYISVHVAEIIDEKAQYIKNKGQSDQYYRQMILDYLAQWEKV